MPVKIRLQRHGKKGKPFYHIVIADSRSPRDGKFIEKIGTYNPTKNPPIINLNSDKAVSWLQDGAQPTDTCRSILSFKGVMYKNHLLGGVQKGALTQDQADAKFEKWVAEKDTKNSGEVTKLDTAKKDAYTKRMAAETAVKEATAAKVLAKNTPLAEEVTETEAEAPVADTTEAPKAEKEEAKKEEPKKEETPKAEVKKEEAPKKEARAEAPKAEVKKEEAPKAEAKKDAKEEK